MIQISIILAISASYSLVEANLEYFRPPDLDLPPHYWTSGFGDNASLSLGANMGCVSCGEGFYNEPPPDDIMFIPAPPLHPGALSSLSELINMGKQGTEDQCIFCNVYYNVGEQPTNPDGLHQTMNNRVVTLLVAFLSISAVLCVYLFSTRRNKMLATIARPRFFKSNEPADIGHTIGKNGSLNQSISNTGVHLSDPCYLQTNRDKNLTSPIISDHVPHKKTAIPSKYWAQPGSIIGRTIMRIPNEYEIPSSRTNSTGTSSAVYADMNNENNQRFLSPYNLHTYAEVPEILDPNDNFHTNSNSSAMLSESNYDNAIYSHGSCLLGSGAVVTGASNGSVQMSHFNSMRPVQSMGYGQSAPMNQHRVNQARLHPAAGQPTYEHPPQRGRIIRGRQGDQSTRASGAIADYPAVV